MAVTVAFRVVGFPVVLVQLLPFSCFSVLSPQDCLRQLNSECVGLQALRCPLCKYDKLLRSLDNKLALEGLGVLSEPKNKRGSVCGQTALVWKDDAIRDLQMHADYTVTSCCSLFSQAFGVGWSELIEMST